VVVAGSGLYSQLTGTARWAADGQLSMSGARHSRAVGDLGVALNETMVFEEAWVRVTWVVPELVEWVVSL
jgi:hypothetical protein